MSRLIKRFRDEAGFGLVELMIALIVLVVGVFAMIGVFQTSLLHLGRATTVATATAVGEQQLENFRAVKYDVIGLEPTAFAVVVSDSVYTSDAACASSCTVAGSGAGQTVTIGGSGLVPTQTLTGADGKSYRVDTYITWQSITSGRVVKQISVVVRNTDATRVWARITSSFDESTGS
jgi:Tfp pilus assembly protein PilV